MCIDFCITEACKCALSNTFCHWCLADNQDIVFYCCIPQIESKAVWYITIFLFGFCKSTTIDIVGNIKRIETTLGINFKDVGIRMEYIFSNIPLIDESWLGKFLRELFIIKAPASQTVAHMHVHHSPRSQHGFFVRITESVKDCRDAFYAFFDCEFVCCSYHFPNTLSCFPKDVGIVVFLELFELFLVNAFGHELFP